MRASTPSTPSPAALPPATASEQALRAEVSSRRGLLGASVFGLDDVARVLHPFLRRFRAAQALDPSLTPFILTADIRHAFDSGARLNACIVLRVEHALCLHSLLQSR